MTLLQVYIVFSYGFNIGMIADLGGGQTLTSMTMLLFSPVTFPYFAYHLFIK